MLVTEMLRYNSTMQYQVNYLQQAAFQTGEAACSIPLFLKA